MTINLRDLTARQQAAGAQALAREIRASLERGIMVCHACGDGISQSRGVRLCTQCDKIDAPGLVGDGV